VGTLLPIVAVGGTPFGLHLDAHAAASLSHPTTNTKLSVTTRMTDPATSGEGCQEREVKGDAWIRRDGRKGDGEDVGRDKGGKTSTTCYLALGSNARREKGREGKEGRNKFSNISIRSDEYRLYHLAVTRV
jgi:hypothetical protein